MGVDRNLPDRHAGYVDQRNTKRNRHLVFHLIGDLDLRRLTSHGERTQKRQVRETLPPMRILPTNHYKPAFMQVSDGYAPSRYDAAILTCSRS